MNSLDLIAPGHRVAVIAAHKLARDDFGARDESTQLQRALTRVTDATAPLVVVVIDRFAAVQRAGEPPHEDPERAVEVLGQLACTCARLCEVNALGLRPLFDLARVYTRQHTTGATAPLLAAGLLCGVVSAAGCDQMRLVDAIGLVLAKAIDEVEIVHELKIDLPGVYTTIARETLGMAPVIEATDALGEKLEPGKPYTQLAVPLASHVRRERALVALKGGLDDLEQAERVEGTGDFDVSDIVRHDRICPQCAAPLSDPGDSGVLVCSNGHDITAAQLASTAPQP